MVLVACGGKTDGGDGDGGQGGNGAGGSSAGGSGGSVQTGGVGGSGGSSVGGTGGTQSTVDKLCEKFAQSACPIPNCKGEIQESIAIAEQFGCTNEMREVLQCVIEYPVYCGPDGDPAPPPECSPQMDQLQTCFGDEPSDFSCSGHSSDENCSLSCSSALESWGVKCWVSGAGLTCNCVVGPNAGFTFDYGGACGSPGWRDTMELFCR